MLYRINLVLTLSSLAFKRGVYSPRGLYYNEDSQILFTSRSTIIHLRNWRFLMVNLNSTFVTKCSLDFFRRYFHQNSPFYRKIEAKTDCSEASNNVKHFCLFVYCISDSSSNLWSCKAMIEFRLMSQKEGVPNYTKTVEQLVVQTSFRRLPQQRAQFSNFTRKLTDCVPSP